MKEVAPAAPGGSGGKAPNGDGKNEDDKDALSEAIKNSGGAANLSTLTGKEGAGSNKPKTTDKQKNELAGVAKYGSRQQDTYKLAMGQYEGGMKDYSLRWGDEVETEAQGE